MEGEFIVLSKSQYDSYIKYKNEDYAKKVFENFVIEDGGEFIVVKVIGKVKSKSV